MASFLVTRGRRRLVVATVPLSLTWLIHCSSSGHTDADANRHAMPTVHRASAETCSAVRAPSVTHDGGFNPHNPYATCHADAECTQGRNGRCQGVYNSAACACDYDECLTDAECPSDAVCVCRSYAPSSAPNYCSEPGNCATDADCGSGYCSPSVVGDLCNEASIAFFCHAQDDECGDDADCPGNHCIYKGSKTHWACTGPIACDGGVQALCQ